MKTLALPQLPAHLQWVIHAEPDRFTVNLSYRVPPSDDENADARSGYIKSHTHRHQCPIERAEWEDLVVNAANHLWIHHTEGILYAQWADELMRRTQ